MRVETGNESLQCPHPPSPLVLVLSDATTSTSQFESQTVEWEKKTSEVDGDGGRTVVADDVWRLDPTTLSVATRDGPSEEKYCSRSDGVGSNLGRCGEVADGGTAGESRRRSGGCESRGNRDWRDRETKVVWSYTTTWRTTESPFVPWVTRLGRRS